jgi:hydroxymethylglutaryl-CoA reductase (NADPH)
MVHVLKPRFGIPQQHFPICCTMISRGIYKYRKLLSSSAPPSKQRVKLNDQEIKDFYRQGKIKFFNIENSVDGEYHRAVKIRREIVQEQLERENPKTNAKNLSKLPFEDYDYGSVIGQCCENVIGYVPIPVGVAGPILVNGKSYYLPMATTEGALVASTTRGCKALSSNGVGVTAIVLNDGMSRAPVLSAPSAEYACRVKDYIDANLVDGDQGELAQSIAKTSRFARLQTIKTFVVGRKLYIRFTCSSGDAMGMNMVGKAVDRVIEDVLLTKFPELQILSLSGNVCTDKKASAVNWIQGRGKSVIAEAVISNQVVKDVLKTSVEAMCELNVSKNLVGSSVAGSIGGFNAHASNIVTAMFIATGQDPAQNVESSSCITLFEPYYEMLPKTVGDEDNSDVEYERVCTGLYASVTLPSMEVGTVGGGTSLASQSALLDMLGVQGSCRENPGDHARQLAKLVASGVLAGELSLMAALSSGHLIKSHMALNRKSGPKS